MLGMSFRTESTTWRMAYVLQVPHRQLGLEMDILGCTRGPKAELRALSAVREGTCLIGT